MRPWSGTGRSARWSDKEEDAMKKPIATLLGFAAVSTTVS